MQAPKDAVRAFNLHKQGAAFRGIPFTLSLFEWWELWQPHWNDKARLQLQMCRTNDQGGYVVGNVRIDTKQANLEEQQRPSTPRTPRQLVLLPGKTLTERLNRHEVRAIRRALVLCDGNMSAAARLLGMTFRQMRYALAKHARLAQLFEASALADI